MINRLLYSNWNLLLIAAGILLLIYAPAVLGIILALWLGGWVVLMIFVTITDFLEQDVQRK